jgi:hypothetical protein
VGSRLERCFFEEAFFFFAVVEEADEDDCGWRANAGVDEASRAAAIARRDMVRFIEVGPLLYYRAIKFRDKLQKMRERLLDTRLHEQDAGVKPGARHRVEREK